MKRVCGRPQREITVYLENGDHFNTKINATVPAIVKMYLEQPVPMYYGENPTMLRARSVVFHNEPCRKRTKSSEVRERLTKIWNLTDATMRKCGYNFRTRVEYEVIPPFRPVSWRESCAYFPSSLYDRTE